MTLLSIWLLGLDGWREWNPPPWFIGTYPYEDDL